MKVVSVIIISFFFFFFFFFFSSGYGREHTQMTLRLETYLKLVAMKTYLNIYFDGRNSRSVLVRS